MSSKYGSKQIISLRFLVSMLAFFAFFASISELSTRAYSITWQAVIADIDSSTQGIIRESYLDRAGGRQIVYAYKVKYEYKVGSQFFLNSIVAHSPVTRNVAQTLEKYPKGKTVTVFYDSANPNYSILERDNFSYVLIINIALAFLGSLFFACLFVYAKGVS